jgi:hypothetical protein
VSGPKGTPERDAAADPPEGFRPAWLDYWNRHPHDPSFPPFNANWTKSDHAHGVGFYAPWEEVDAGFPEHARRCAVALAATGIPLHLRSLTGGMQFHTAKDPEAAKGALEMKRRLEPLLTASIKTYDVDIFQVIGEETGLFRLAAPTHPFLDARELGLIYARRIVSTVFERDRVSPSVAGCLRAVGGVWVANHQDRRMLLGQGLDESKVVVIPVPFFPGDPHLGLEARPRLAGPVRFYHIGKWEPRKAQHRIVGAFLMAFRPGEAKLYLKTSLSGVAGQSYPGSAPASLKEWLADARVAAMGWTFEEANKHLFIINRRLTPEQMLALHRQSDVYVTLSHGEGFDMPAFDAKLAGNLMVYTPSGGPQDFAGDADERVEPTSSIPCDPFYGWGDARYLDYDIEAAVAALRAAKHKIEAGERRRGVDLSAFGAAAVGARMRAAVEALR